MSWVDELPLLQCALLCVGENTQGAVLVLLFGHSATAVYEESNVSNSGIPGVVGDRGLSWMEGGGIMVDDEDGMPSTEFAFDVQVRGPGVSSLESKTSLLPGSAAVLVDETDGRLSRPSVPDNLTELGADGTSPWLFMVGIGGAPLAVPCWQSWPGLR